jgi:methyl-accepting chemotaxis protein
MPSETTLFRRLSLRGKLFLNLGLVCVLIGALALFANWCMSVVASMSEKTLGGSVVHLDIANSVAEETLQCRRYEKDFFLNLNNAEERGRYRKEWLDAFGRLRKAIEDFRNNAAGPEDQETVRKWTEATARYQTAMQTVLRQVDDGAIQKPEQANEAMSGAKDSIRELTALATDTAHRKLEEVRHAEQDLSQVISLFRMLILGVALAAVLGSAVWSYRTIQDLTRPIAALQDAARKFADGDLYTRVDLRRTDEIGSLADSFNRMVSRIRQRTQAIERTSRLGEPDKKDPESE